MLRIGIASSAYFTYQNDEVAGLQKAKLHGFDCLDYQDFSSSGAALMNVDLAEFKRYLSWLKAEADQVGIAFHQAHGLWWMDEKDLEERKQNVELYKKQILGCALLGCPNLVIHPCCPGGWNWFEMDDRQAAIEGNLAVLQEILPYAKENGVTICLENLPFATYSLANTPDVKELVRLANDAYVKVCLDTGHACCRQENIYEAIRLLGDDLACLHVHDDKKRQDNHLIPFLGEVDWDGFIKGLREIRFQGVINLETAIPAKMPQPMRETMQRTLAQIAQYMAAEIDK